MNFKAVLELPKTAWSAQTHKSISFIWIVWSTLYVYLWQNSKPPSFGFAGRWHHNSFNMYVLRLKGFCWLFFSDGSFSSMFHSSFWQKTFFSANTYPQKCVLSKISLLEKSFATSLISFNSEYFFLTFHTSYIWF